jgi:hypothetical protein
MVTIFGKKYYIDIDGITEKCKIEETTKEEEDGLKTLEINLFKYDIIKMCLERILNEFNEVDVDEEIAFLSENTISPSFKIAFNTLIKNKILIEDYDRKQRK